MRLSRLFVLGPRELRAFAPKSPEVKVGFLLDSKDKVLQQALDVDGTDTVQRAARRRRRQADLTGPILARLARIDGQSIQAKLRQLKVDDPSLYATAMSALQAKLGNRGVGQLHRALESSSLSGSATGSAQGSSGGSARGSSVSQRHVSGESDAAVGLPTGGSDSQRDLPVDLRSKMESAFGADFGSVRVYVGPQAADIGALAFAQGENIHFAPGEFQPNSRAGQFLVGHELAHVVQQRAGRVRSTTSSGGVPINDDPGLEAEADQMGERAADGEPADVAGAVRSELVAADSDARQAKVDGAAPIQRSLPDKFTFRIAGKSITVKKPNMGSAKYAKFRINKTPVPGVTLTTGRLDFNDDWTLKKGTIRADVSAGSYVSAKNAKLTVTEGADQKYNVRATAKADVKVGELLSGTLNCTFASDGTSGTGNIEASKIKVGHNVAMVGGKVAVTLSKGGDITGSGKASAKIDKLGKIAFAATVNNTTLGGTMALTLDPGIKVVDKVIIDKGSLSGKYSDSALKLNGKINLKVADWATAEITGDYDHVPKKWGAKGTLKQTAGERSFDELKVKNGELTVVLADSKLTKVDAKADYTIPYFKGSLAGSYRVSDEKFSGSGSGELTDDLRIGTKLTVKEAKGAGTIKDNAIEKLVGEATAHFVYDKKDMFEVVGKDLTYESKNNGVVSGSGTVTLLEELTLGDTTKTHGKVLKDATGSVTVKDNKVDAITGGIAFKVNDFQDELGSGKVSLKFAGKEGEKAISGEGSFTLSKKMGMPDKNEGPVYLLEKSTITAKVDNGAFTELGLSQVKFYIDKIAADAEGKTAGKIDGTLTSGTINLKNPEKSSCKGSAEISEGWSVTSNGVTFTFKTGGKVEVDVSGGKLKKATVNIPFALQVTAKGNTKIDFAGTLDGSYDATSKQVGGTITVSPKEHIWIQSKTDWTKIDKSSKATATFSNSTLESLKVNLKLGYYVAGKDKLLVEGTISDATYNPKTNQVTAKGGVKLKREFKKKAFDGDWMLVIAAGATCDIDVKDNDLENVTGNIDFAVHKGDDKSPLFKGALKNAKVSKSLDDVSGSLEVTLAKTVSFPKMEAGKADQVANSEAGFGLAIGKGSTVTGEIKNNKLDKLGTTLKLRVQKDETLIATGDATGQFDFKVNKFTGTGTLTSKKNYLLVSTKSVEFTNTAPPNDPDLLGWSLWLKSGAKIAVDVKDNGLEKTKVSTTLAAKRKNRWVAEGTLDGQYKFGAKNGFSGNFGLGVTSPISMGKIGDFGATLNTDTKFSGTAKNSNIETAAGVFGISITKGGTEYIKVSTPKGVKYTHGTGIAGDGEIRVVKDLDLVELTDYRFRLKQGSGGTGEILANKVDKLSGELTLTVFDKKAKQDLAVGEFKFAGNSKVSVDGTKGQNSQLAKDLKATVKFCKDYNIPITGIGAAGEGGKGADKWELVTEESSGISLHLKMNALDQVKGDLKAKLVKNGTAFASATIDADYKAGDGGKSPVLSGDGALSLLQPLKLADIKIPGDTAKYALFMTAGAGIGFEVAQSKLKRLKAGAVLRLDKGGKPQMKLTLAGSYQTDPTMKIEGKVDVELLESFLKYDKAGYWATILKGGTLSAEFSGFGLKSFEAKALNLNVGKEGGSAFLSVKCSSANWSPEKSLDATGSVNILNPDFVLYSHQGANLSFDATLRQESGMDFHVKGGAFERVSGAVGITLKRSGAPLVDVKVAGSYDREKGLSGFGQAKLLDQVKIADIAKGKYSIWLDAGSEGHSTGLEFHFIENAATVIGGQVCVSMKTGTAKTSPNLLEGKVGGKYDIKGGTGLTGGASLTVATSTPIAKAGDYSLILSSKSQIAADFAQSALKKFGGNVVLQIDDAKGALAELTFDGNFDVDAGEFTGGGGFKVLNDRELFKYKKNYGFVLKAAGSEARIDLVKNQLSRLSGALNFEVNSSHPALAPLATAKLKGDWVADKAGGAGKYTGTADLELTNDFELALGKPSSEPKSSPASDGSKWIEGWSLAIGKGSALNLTLTNNEPQGSAAKVTLSAKVKNAGREVATGKMDGTYLLGAPEGFSGTAELDLVARLPLGSVSVLGRSFTLEMAPPTHVDAEVRKSELASAKGKFILIVKEGEDKLELTLDGAYKQGAGISVEGKLKAVADLLLGEIGSTDAIYLKQGSGGSVTVKNNKLERIAGEPIMLRYDRDGKPLAKGSFDVGVDTTQASPKVTAKGKAELVDTYNLTPKGKGGWFAVLTAGTGFELSLKDSQLDYIDGALKAQLQKPLNTAIIDVSVKGRYTAGAKPSLDVKGNAAVVGTTDVFTTKDGWVVMLEAPSQGFAVEIAKSELQSLGAGVQIRLDKPKGKGIVRLKLKGQYTHKPTPTFDGEASADLLSPLSVNQTLGGADYLFTLASGASLSAKLKDSDLQEISGKGLKLSVADSSAEFLVVNVEEGRYFKDGNEGKVTLKGAAQITNEAKVFYTHSAGEIPYDLHLLKGSGTHIDLQANKLNRVDGTINALVKRNKADFVKINLDGYYNKAEKFNGTAKAQLLTDHEVGNVGKYSLWLEANEQSQTGLELGMKAGSLTDVGGSIALSLREGAGASSSPIFKGSISGAHYEFGKPNTFRGKGVFTVPKLVAISPKTNGYQLFLGDLTRVNVDFSGGSLKKIDGDIRLRVNDKQGELVEVKLGGGFDVERGEFTGSGGLSVLNDRKIFGYGAFEFWLRAADSKSTAEITKNSLVKLAAGLNFEVKHQNKPLATAGLSGTWLREGNNYTGKAELLMVDDYRLKAPKSKGAASWIESWALVVAKGSNLKMTLSNSSPDRGGAVTAKLIAKVEKDSKEVANGTLEGAYTLGAADGFSGKAVLGVTEDISLGKTKGFEFLIGTGTHADAQAQKSELVSAKATFIVLARQGTDKLKLKVDGDYQQGAGITANAKLDVLEDLNVFSQGDHALFVQQGSGGELSVVKNEFKSIKGEPLKLRYDLAGTELANGTFNVGFELTEGKKTEVSADGKVQIVGTADLTPEGLGDYHFWIEPSQGLNFKLTKSKLDEAGGKIQVGVKEGDTRFLELVLQGDYTSTPKPSFIGKGSAKVVAEKKLFDYQLYSFLLEPCPGLSFQVDETGLKELGGKLVVRIDEDGTQRLRLVVDGKYLTGKEQRFDGSAEATVLSRMAVAENVASSGYSFFLLKGENSLSANVVNNEFTEAHGKIGVEVEDADSAFLTVVGQVDYAKKGDAAQVDANGAIEVTRDKELAKYNEWTFILEKGSGGTAVVKANALEAITGTIQLLVKKGDENFARVALDGSYAKGKFTGNGAAQLLSKFKATDIGSRFKLWLDEGTGARIELKDNAVERISSLVNVRLCDGETDFIEGHLDIDYQFKTKNLKKAGGSAKVVNDYRLVGGDAKAGWAVWLMQGSGIDILYENNDLSHIGGSVNVRVDDPTGPLLKIAFRGKFDAKNNTGLTGDGQITVLGTRKVLTVGNKYDIYLTASSGAKARVEKSRLKRVNGKVSWLLKDTEGDLAEGDVTGDWQLGTKDVWKAAGSVKLLRDYHLAGGAKEGTEGQVDSWSAWLKKYSSVAIDVGPSGPKSVAVDVGLMLKKGSTNVAEGNVKGTYNFADESGYTGDASFDVISTVHLVDAGRFKIHLERGTSVSAKIAKSKVISAKGRFSVLAKENGTDSIRLTLEDVTYTPATGLSGSGKLEVLAPIKIYDGKGYQLYLDTGAGADGTIKNNALKAVNGSLKLRLDKANRPFARGDFEINYKIPDGTSLDAKVSAEGSIELIGELEMTSQTAKYRFFLEGGSNIKAKLTDSELDWIDGQVKVRCEDKDGAFGKIDVKAKYQHRGRQRLDANGSAELTRKVSLGLKVLGYDICLGPGTGAKIKVTDSKLDTLSANVSVCFDKANKTCVLVKLKGTYKHKEGGGVFDGDGSAEVLSKLTIAKDVGKDKYSFFLLAGSGLAASVKANKLKKLEGQLTAEVAEGENAFLVVDGHAEYNVDDAGKGKLGADASVTVTREKKLKTVGDYTFFLSPCQAGKIDIKNNELESLSAEIQVVVKKGTVDFAEIILVGKPLYSKKTGFSATGKARLLAKQHIAKLGKEYDAYLLPTDAPTAEITVKNNELTHIGANATILITENKSDFMKGSISIDYQMVGEKKFGGNGEVSVLKDKKLASFKGPDGVDTLYLSKGSGVKVEAANNKLTKVSGNIRLRVEDPNGDTFLKVFLDGSWDPKTGFTGNGGAEVVTDRKMVTVGKKYAFWVTKSQDGGAGFKVWIKDNKLTKAKGWLNLQIRDPKEPLLEGRAEGTYDPTTGFSGSGAIYLARDINFGKKDGVQITFMKGSGGKATVSKNKLEKLGGTLKCEVKTKKVTVYIEASGEYDAVNNKILWAKGKAKVKTPLTFFGGKITVSNLEGEGEIKNNEIVRVAGKGQIEANFDKFKATGWFQVEWWSEGGKDFYKGKGKVQFAIKKPKIWGEVDIEYDSKGKPKFKINGVVNYQMNKFISGKIGIYVDDKLDPCVSGELRVTDKEIVKGRDLINFSQALIPWVPITIFGVQIGIGVDVGFKVSLKPVLFSASLRFSDFYPKRMNVPNFEARADINTGINLHAAILPYATLGFGVGSLGAGIKLQGEVALDVPVDVNPYLILRGKDGKFSGELGINVAVEPEVTLSFVPILFARCPGIKPAEKELSNLKREWPMGKLFSWKWNAAYHFGDDPPKRTKASEGQKRPSGPGKKSQKRETIKEGKQNGIPGYGSPKTASNIEGSAQLEDPSKMKAEQTGDPAKKGGPMSEMKEKFNKVKRMGYLLARVAHLFKFLVSLVTLTMTFSFLGPLAPLLALVFSLFVSPGGGPGGIAEDIKAVFEIAGMLKDWVWDNLVPGWIKTVRKVMDKGLVWAADELYAWGKRTINGFWWQALEPIFDWARNQAEKLVVAAEGFGDGIGGTVKAIVKVLIASFSGIRSLWKAIKRVWEEIKKLIYQLAMAGQIIAVDTNPDDWGKNPWKWYINLPGIYTTGPHHGDGWWNWLVGQLLEKGLRSVFDVPRSHDSNKRRGIDYPKKSIT